MSRWVLLALFFLSAFFYFKIRPHHIPIVISSYSPYEFCNGNQMKPDQWMKTITLTQIKPVRKFWISRQMQLNLSVLYAASAMHLAKYDLIPHITLSRGIAYVDPVEGFAGVSIWMCQYKPVIEKNIKQYPYVHHIVWQSI